VAKPSERGLRRQVDDLRDDHADGDDVENVRVEWRDAAPDERPDGVTWRPATDDGDPARLAYDVWDAQRNVLDAVESGDHDIVAFLAGYGSGKSVFGARWLLASALDNPGSRFLCMGQSFAEARDTTFTKFFEQLPGGRTALRTSGYNGPESSPIVSDYNRQERRLTLTNDAVIVLGSADKYSRFAGAEFGGVWLDEPSHYGDELHDLTGMMTTRLRGVDGPKAQLWTLTGEGYNAAWEILEKRQGADGDDVGLDIDVITASVLDNPYLADGDKERFERKYAGTDKAQQALHGGFAAASGLVYSSFSRDNHVIGHDDALDRVDDGWRVFGYDAGWRDPRVLVEFGRTDRDQLVALDEFYETETPVDRAITWLDGRPKGRIYAEHAPADIQRFEDAGHRVEKAEKDIDDGINQVRERLATDADGRPGLLISERCENLIREFLGYKEEHVGKTGAEDHAADVTRYVCAGEVTLSPRAGGVTLDWGEDSLATGSGRGRRRR
jgi:phage terminase large subunit-like protein